MRETKFQEQSSENNLIIEYCWFKLSGHVVKAQYLLSFSHCKKRIKRKCEGSQHSTLITNLHKCYILIILKLNLIVSVIDTDFLMWFLFTSSRFSVILIRIHWAYFNCNVNFYHIWKKFSLKCCKLYSRLGKLQRIFVLKKNNHRGQTMQIW